VYTGTNDDVVDGGGYCVGVYMGIAAEAYDWVYGGIGFVGAGVL
jgi:hypothetical protein